MPGPYNSMQQRDLQEGSPSCGSPLAGPHGGHPAGHGLKPGLGKGGG
jgi:hypothetical protein